MLYRILYFFLKKKIDFLAQEKLKVLALEKYIDDNFFIAAGSSGVELQFQGKKFIKLMAASVYEIVKEADNYVVMDLNSVGYEPLTVTIQKRWKLSPHDKANKLEKECERLRMLLKTHAPEFKE